MSEVVEWLDRGDPDAHLVVQAAMAHLHLVSVHPFNDGSGRNTGYVAAEALRMEAQSMTPKEAPTVGEVPADVPPRSLRDPC